MRGRQSYGGGAVRADVQVESHGPPRFMRPAAGPVLRAAAGAFALLQRSKTQHMHKPFFTF
jgi:hypothetical protein